MPRKRCITKANSEPLNSLSALWKKNTTVISRPVKSPVLKTLIASKTSNRVIEASARNPSITPLTGAWVSVPPATEASIQDSPLERITFVNHLIWLYRRTTSENSQSANF